MLQAMPDALVRNHAATPLFIFFFSFGRTLTRHENYVSEGVKISDRQIGR